MFDLDTFTLSSLQTLLIDMDGVLYRGPYALPGACELFALIRRYGISYNLITNNSSRTTQQYLGKLRGFGIDVQPEHLLTTGQATAQYLQQVCPQGAPVHVIGEEGLVQPLLEAGFWLDSQSPGYVVVGLDMGFNYEKLKVATRAIYSGARLIASNPDVTFPTEEGILPGAGAFLAAIFACTGVNPLVIGKPETRTLEMAMSRLGATRESTAILGDRLETDILAGRRAGIGTIMVLTGISTRADLEVSEIQPDYVFDDLLGFIAALGQARAGGG